MIKLGIDIRGYEATAGGIPRYTQKLVTAFAQNHLEKLFLFSPLPIYDNSLILENVTLKSANCNNKFKKLIYFQLQLPVWVHQNHIDLFWGPAHRLPF